MKTADFDYHLPDGFIAQHPARRRDLSRLMVLDRCSGGTIGHRRFKDLPAFVSPGDVLVLNNNTRVFPARLEGKLPTGGAFEILLVRKLEDSLWLALVKPGRKLAPGRVVEIGEGALRLKIEDYAQSRGARTVRLESADGAGPGDLIERLGRVPLPPYIRRPDTPGDRKRYQTVYARHTGAVAAPTAGLHFTPAVMNAVRAAGGVFEELTLHVGPGTFRPVTAGRVEDHRMEEEFYEVDPAALNRIVRARESGKRVLAVGTTTVRALETVAARIENEPDALKRRSLSGVTDLFIRPGYRFRLVDRLLTNFHLPRSTLLMLCAAFAGKKLLDTAYSEAIRENYRFYSYGDAMLIL